MSRVELRDVRVRFGDVEVLKGVSLDIAPSEFVAILGPSGCGKTTLLRAIAGFAEHEGDLRVDGRSFKGVPAHRRDMGLVFQDYALFPHKSVAENIAFGLRLRRRGKAEVARRVGDLLRLLQLEGFGERYPSQLSGGQRQRVALARALAIDPKMLLLDEPLSALDKKLREDMQIELRQIQRRVGITSLFVTHDQEEALALADRVIVMNNGQIRQAGAPEEIYRRPADRFVATFIGRSNIFEARCIGAQDGYAVCEIGAGAPIKVAAARGRLAPEEKFFLSVRPENVLLARAGESSAETMLGAGAVMHAVYMGTHQELRIMLDRGFPIEARTDGRRSFAAGERVLVSWAAEDGVLLRE